MEGTHDMIWWLYLTPVCSSEEGGRLSRWSHQDLDWPTSLKTFRTTRGRRRKKPPRDDGQIPAARSQQLGQWLWLPIRRSVVRIQSLSKFILNICLLSTVLKRQKKKRPGMAHFKKEEVNSFVAASVRTEGTIDVNIFFTCMIFYFSYIRGYRYTPK